MPRLSGLRAAPWALALEAAVVANRHWQALSDAERSRLLGLIRSSRGRLGNLSARERADLRKLMGKLDLGGMGREMLPFAGRLRKGR